MDNMSITGRWVYMTDRLPEPGREYVCAVETDDGPEIHTCIHEIDRRGKSVWVHEGEPSFCKGYLFHPYAWAEDLTMPPVPQPEGDD